jgi:uncharacterized OB-fold protein
VTASTPGHDEWLDALASGDPFYLACPDGHAALPPRQVCPDCGPRHLEQRSLPESGEIETVTVTHVPLPRFEADAPYAVAIARFGPVRITGQVRDCDHDRLDPGLTVTLDVLEPDAGTDPVVIFRPVA